MEGKTKTKPVTPPTKKSRWWLWVLIVVLILLTLGAGLCVGGIYSLFQVANVNVNIQSDTNQINSNVPPIAVDETQITDSQLAGAVFGEDSLAGIQGLGQVRPLPIELNAHLDDTPPTTYNFFVARSWVNIPSGNLKLESALVKNPTAAEAVSFLQTRALGKTALAGGSDIADQSVMYFEPATDSSLASVTVRFTDSTIAAKVQVYANADSTKSDADLQTELAPIAVQLAKSQAALVADLLANTLPAPESSPSMTSSLEVNLSGATLVGRLPVTEDEWLAVTGEFSADANMSGLADMAVSRFLVEARPQEVVEVTILDFYVKDIAPEYQAQLITENNQDTEVELPADIAEAADALARETMVESQMVAGNYLIDVAVFSPFGTLDQAAATQDMIKWTQELNTIFNAQ